MLVHYPFISDIGLNFNRRGIVVEKKELVALIHIKYLWELVVCL